MDIISKAKQVSSVFTEYVSKKGLHGIEEINISLSEKELFVIKVFVSSGQNEVVFKKNSNNAFIIVSNGEIIGYRDLNDFSELLNILNLVGVKVLEKAIKPSLFVKEKNIKTYTEKMEQIDRILDVYNKNKILYEILKEEKYLNRQNQIIRLLKKTKPITI